MRYPVLVLILLAMSACVSPATTPRQPLGTADDVSRLYGIVSDDEERPLANASVSLDEGERTATTANDGSYDIAGISPGARNVRIERVGFEPLAVSVDLPAGDAVRQDFRLRPLPAPVERNWTAVYKGQYECAWEFFILGGDCFGIYENVTGQEDPFTRDIYAFRIRIEPGWRQVRLNLTWQGSANNQLEGMRLVLEHGNASKTGHGTQVGGVDGPSSPLQLVVNRGELHPKAERYPNTNTLATIHPNGEEMQIRVFPKGRATQYTGLVCVPGCLWGLGLGLSIQFEVEATVRYGPAI